MSVIAFAAMGASEARPSLLVTDLRCEYRVDPLGMGETNPRLSWVLESVERGQRQTAYRVLVASSPERLKEGKADLWDSGPVKSTRQNQVEYCGKSLRAFDRCFWRVRVWDRSGKPGAWSKTASWTMGPLTDSDWKARWISYKIEGTGLPYLRKSFRIEQPIKRAHAYVCGLGSYEISLNGRKAGDRILDPAWTDYRKSCQYTTYDVTSLLKKGENAVGILLGNSFFHVTADRYTKYVGSFGAPRAILLIRAELADGSIQEIVTDGSWVGDRSPVVLSQTYGGEDYDARLEQPGWDTAGFAAHGWKPVQLAEPPGGKLVAGMAAPIKIMETFAPVKVTEPRPGVRVYDMGQNCSALPEITVEGTAGATVKITPGELLDEQGLVSQRSSGGPSFFTYTLKGMGPETWRPRFTYYGSRYLQIECAARILDVKHHFVRSSADTVGSFACSKPLFNDIHKLINEAIKSNLQWVLTDCPHREKLGWLEVSHLLGPAVMFNYDVPTLYEKIVQDCHEAQLENGLVPDIAPEYTVFQGGFRDSPEWGSAFVVDPWLMYQRYGDTRVLARHYDAMKRYVDYLTSKAQDHIVAYGLGDWYDIGPGGPGESKLTSKGVTASVMYYSDLAIIEEAARVLGKTDDAEWYGGMAEQVKHAFNLKFFNPATDQYDRGSQCANAMPVFAGMAPPNRVPAIVENIVKDVREKGNQVTAGDVGFRFLAQALNWGGRSDVLFDMCARSDGPGYAYQIKHGATSLTEAWDTDRGSSQNHCMLGHAEEWFYNGLGGIEPDPAGVGFEKVLIRPQIVGDLTWVKTSYRSIRGRIVSNWAKSGENLTMTVTIPPNSTATIFVPTKDPSNISEGGKPATRSTGLKLLRTEPHLAVFSADSGTYSLAAKI